MLVKYNFLYQILQLYYELLSIEFFYWIDIIITQDTNTIIVYNIILFIYVIQRQKWECNLVARPSALKSFVRRSVALPFVIFFASR